MTTAKSTTAMSSAFRSTAMAAALSAELDDSVPIDLVAEIVRSVLDDSRCALNGAEGAAMIEARLRIERFVRARTSGAGTPR